MSTDHIQCDVHVPSSSIADNPADDELSSKLQLLDVDSSNNETAVDGKNQPITDAFPSQAIGATGQVAADSAQLLDSQTAQPVTGIFLPSENDGVPKVGENIAMVDGQDSKTDGSPTLDSESLRTSWYKSLSYTKRHEWFVDCYRLCVADDATNKLYRGLYLANRDWKDPYAQRKAVVIEDFLFFMKLAVRNGALPKNEKEFSFAECLKQATKLLGDKFEESDVQEKWGGESAQPSFASCSSSLRGMVKLVHGDGDGGKGIYNAVIEEVDALVDSLRFWDSNKGVFAEVGGRNIWIKLFNKLSVKFSSTPPEDDNIDDCCKQKHSHCCEDHDDYLDFLRNEPVGDAIYGLPEDYIVPPPIRSGDEESDDDSLPELLNYVPSHITHQINNPLPATDGHSESPTTTNTQSANYQPAAYGIREATTKKVGNVRKKQNARKTSKNNLQTSWYKSLSFAERHEWFVDCYRMRTDDDYAWGGGNLHGLYECATSDESPMGRKVIVVKDFLIFMKLAVRRGILPSNHSEFSFENCLMKAAQLLGFAFEKSDAQEKWGGENVFSALGGKPSLRLIAELIYGSSCMGGIFDESDELYDEVEEEVEDMVDDRKFKNTHGCVFEEVGGKNLWINLHASLNV